MKTVTRVWSVLETYVQALSFLLALLCVFVVATPRAEAATANTFQQNLVTALLSFFGTDKTTINQVAAVLNAQEPTTQTTLVTSVDASSPAYTLSAGGTANVVLGIYKFRATGEDMRLTKVVFSLGNALPQDVTSVRLSDIAGVVVGSTNSIVGQNVYLNLANPILIPKDTEIKLVLRGDLAPLGPSLARSGDLIAPAVQSETTAVTTLSGATIPAIGGVPVPGVRIVESYPMVSLDPLPYKGVTDGRLVRFKITANNTGPIAIGKLGFSVIAPFANVSNTALFAYTDASYANPHTSYAADGRVGVVGGISGNTFSIVTSRPLVVAAGTTMYFELRADVVPATTRITVVGSSLLGDSVYVGAGMQDQLYPARFVWSPSVEAVTSASSTAWFNGYGVSGLIVPGLSQSRYGSAKTVGTANTNTALAAALPLAAAALSDMSGGALPYKATTTVGIMPPPVQTVLASSTATYSLAVTPSSGAAPLTVVANIGISREASSASMQNCVPGVGGVIMWGDGAAYDTVSSQDCAASALTASHTYAKRGTYTVRFYKNGNTPCLGMVCVHGPVPKPVASTTIVVTNAELNTQGPIPTCTISANKTSVQKGAAVNLTWKSKYATSASLPDGSKLGKPEGTTKVRPTEDTVYVKRVYGPGGEGTCQILIDVLEDTEGTPVQKMAFKLPPSVAQALNDMQLGAVIVAETALQVFGKDQTAAAANGPGITCSLTGPASATVKNAVAFSWTTTGNPTSVTLSLGSTVLAGNLPTTGTKTVTAPVFPAKYNYRLTVSNGSATSDCYFVATVLAPNMTAPLAKVWPQLFGQVGSYGYSTRNRQELIDEYVLGFKLNAFARSSPETDADMETYEAARIDMYPQRALAAMCQKAVAGCKMTETQLNELLADIKTHLDATKNDKYVVAYMLMDDYPGDIRTYLSKVHALIAEANKTSVVVRPAICAFNLNIVTIAANEGPLSNFSPTSCDAFNLYFYGYKWSWIDFQGIGIENTASKLRAAQQVLLSMGWDQNKQPFIGVPHMFGDDKHITPDRQTEAKHVRAICDAGASSLLFFEWHYNHPELHSTNPQTAPEMLKGFQDGLQTCMTGWQDKTVVDTTAPTVSITAPVAGNVSGTVVVKANASDNTGVVGVQFKADGKNIGDEQKTAPYSVSWNSVGVDNGKVVLQAVARDAAGNKKTDTLEVEVSNTIVRPTDKVTLYTECDFKGAATSLGVGSYGLTGNTGLEARGVKNDTISSVYVPQGYAVKLYEHDGGNGRTLTLTDSNTCLSGANFDNILSSMVITKTLDTGTYVTLYQECNYKGDSVKLPVGSYTLADVIRYGGKNDVFSSIKVPDGFAVTLYEHDDYGGRVVTRSSDDSCFTDDNFDNILSSVRVSKEVITPKDTASPTVSITTPANGSTVSGWTAVSAAASDNVAVVGVQFKREGLIFGAEDTSAPYSINWNTASTSNGSHTFAAVARDAAGNRATSTVTVTVSNVPTPSPSKDKPLAAKNPSPANNATDQSYDAPTLSWQNGGGATSYGVYVGGSANSLKLVASSGTNVTLPKLAEGSTYYWRVDSVNSNGTTTGDVWSFTNATAPLLVPPAPTSSVVTLYKDCGYKGTAKTFTAGSYDVSEIAAAIGNDQASSIKIPAGYTVVLYQHEKYGGKSITLNKNTDCFVDLSFNDQLSSMKITTTAPTCTLTASQTSVPKNTSITLTWTSENAVYASNTRGLTNTKVNGTMRATTTQDTLYVKHVYGPGGDTTCSVRVDVQEDTNATTLNRLVWNPIPLLAAIFSNMQTGAVVLAESYQSLFSR